MGKTRKSQNSLYDLQKPVLVKELNKLNRHNRQLNEKNKKLEQRIKELEAQLEEYRKKIFKKNKVKPEDEHDPAVPKKRAAPVGHPGVTRATPDHFDKHVDVTLEACPDCGGENLSRCKRYDDHYQDDIVLPEKKVTRFRHYYYYCKNCRKTVHGMGEGELPQSYIGPVAKSRQIHKKTAQADRGTAHLPGVCRNLRPQHWAERLLRSSVIMRKITFGNRSEKGMQNHQVLMSLIQTACHQNLNPLTILHQLLTDPAVAATAILPKPASTG